MDLLRGLRGLRGHPLHPPPTDATIGMFALATGLETDSDALAWIAFVLLLIVALLGFTTFAIWLQRRQDVAPSPAGAEVAGPSPERPAERRFPVPILAAHGVLAATTLVLVFLTAIGVGTS